MVSPLQAALAATHAATRRVRGEDVTYTRGATEISLSVTRASTRWDVEQPESGVSVEEHSTDFLIVSADLVAGGITTGPQRGDTVTDAAGTIYRVMPFVSGEAVWRWHDRSRTVLRIYSKER